MSVHELRRALIRERLLWEATMRGRAARRMTWQPPPPIVLPPQPDRWPFRALLVGLALGSGLLVLAALVLRVGML